jgi:hypothetical protein
VVPPSLEERRGALMTRISGRKRKGCTPLRTPL